MEKGVQTQKIRIGGMTCVNCERIITKKLLATPGVQAASVRYSSETAQITYDSASLSFTEIEAALSSIGYSVLPEARRTEKLLRAALAIPLAVALYFLFQRLYATGLFSAFQAAEAGMRYAALPVVGLLTSFHCVAMCGGISLSQCMPRTEGEGGRMGALLPSFQYNLGRVIAYTVIGGIVGALGSAVRLTGALSGIVQLLGGAFMVIMGLSMLRVFPSLRRLVPRMPAVFARKIDAQKRRVRRPLYVGLLNGLMPCGPLQAMQLYALSTGSIAQGALAMFLFSIGTVPLMFGLGALGSLLSRRFMQRAMTVGAALVMALGVSMFAQGLALSGQGGSSPTPAPISTQADAGGDAVQAQDTQIIRSTLSGRRYPAITVSAGTPVKWIIDAPEGSINGCNNSIVIPAYNLTHDFAYGENVIEFTPTETGTFRYSCWMGMIRSTITVVAPEA